MNESNLYAKVCQAISEKSAQCAEERHRIELELYSINRQLERESSTLPNVLKCSLNTQAEVLKGHIERLNIAMSTWDQARELCQQVADDGREE